MVTDVFAMLLAVSVVGQGCYGPPGVFLLCVLRSLVISVSFKCVFLTMYIGACVMQA